MATTPAIPMSKGNCCAHKDDPGSKPIQMRSAIVNPGVVVLIRRAVPKPTLLARAVQASSRHSPVSVSPGMRTMTPTATTASNPMAVATSTRPHLVLGCSST